VGIAFDPLKTKNHHQTFGEKEKKNDPDPTIF